MCLYHIGFFYFLFLFLFFWLLGTQLLWTFAEVSIVTMGFHFSCLDTWEQNRWAVGLGEPHVHPFDHRTTWWSRLPVTHGSGWHRPCLNLATRVGGARGGELGFTEPRLL